jgi:DNA-binding beta-propeller fold protein YncE
MVMATVLATTLTYASGVTHASAVTEAAPVGYVTSDASLNPGALTAFDSATGGFSGAIRVRHSPGALAITPDGSEVLVATGPHKTVVPVNAGTFKAGTPIAVAFDPLAIAISPDGRTAYVSGGQHGKVQPIDLTTNVAGTAIKVGSFPSALAITPDGSTLYVASNADNVVTPITLATMTRGTPIKVGQAPVSIVITPDGHHAFVANQTDWTVTPLDLTNGTAGTPIPLRGPATGLAITPDGSRVFAADDFGSVTQIDVATLASTPVIESGNQFDGVAVTADGLTGYLVEVGNNTLIPFDTSTYALGNPTQLGGAGIFGRGIAIAPDAAPVAHLDVTTAPHGSATSFDASASTVEYGHIARYAWNFGDGTVAKTTTATTNHVYASAGSYHVSVTETDSAGTSTTIVFTGQTVTRNGGPSARATQTIPVT